MNTPRKRPIIIGVCLFTVSGCASLPADRGFEPVRSVTQERLGQDLYWQRLDTAEQTPLQAEIKAQIETLLKAPLNCDSSSQIALLNNPALQAQYENLSLAQANAVDAGSISNPVLEAGVLFGEEGSTLDFGLTQSLFSLLYLSKRKKLANSQTETEQAALSQAVFALANNSYQACINAIEAQQLLGYQKQQVDANEAAVFAAERLFEAGNTAQTTVIQARARLNQAQTSLVALQHNAKRSQKQLALWLGLDHSNTLQLPSKLPPMPAQSPAFKLDEAGLNNHLLQQAEQNSFVLQQAKSRLKEAGYAAGIDDISPLLKHINLGLMAERSNGDWEQGFKIEIALPLFNSGAARKEKIQAKLTQRAGEYRATSLRVRQQAQLAAAAFRAAEYQLDSYIQQLLPAQRQRMRQQLRQYNAMQIGVFDLLAEAETSAQIKQQWVQALANYWRARQTLKLILAGAEITATSKQTPSLTASDNRANAH